MGIEIMRSNIAVLVNCLVLSAHEPQQTGQKTSKAWYFVFLLGPVCLPYPCVEALVPLF